MKYAYLFVFLFALSCGTPKKTTKKNTEETVVKVEKVTPKNNVTPVVPKEELLVVFKDLSPKRVASAKALIVNSGLDFNKMVHDQETLKIGLIKVPADKKDFWIKRLLQSEEFVMVEENSQTTIKTIIENSNKTFFSMQKTPCFGDCAVFELTIDKEGNVTFNGKQYVKKEGITEFKLTDSQFKTFKDKLSKRSFSSYNAVYDNPRLADLPSTIIKHDNKQIKIRIWRNVPVELIEATEYLDEILRSKNLYD